MGVNQDLRLFFVDLGNAPNESNMEMETDNEIMEAKMKRSKSGFGPISACFLVIIIGGCIAVIVNFIILFRRITTMYPLDMKVSVPPSVATEITNRCFRRYGRARSFSAARPTSIAPPMTTFKSNESNQDISELRPFKSTVGGLVKTTPRVPIRGIAAQRRSYLLDAAAKEVSLNRTETVERIGRSKSKI